MKQPLKILLLEDSATDAEIVERLLKKDNCPFTCRLSVDKTSFLRELTTFQPEIVLADNALPQFDATEALELVQQYLPHTAFILVTGTVSEEFAAGIIKKGADDYVLKDRLARLPAAIEAALKYRRIEKEKNIAAEQLRESEEKYRTLVEHAFDGILIYSLDGSILDCNHSTCSFLGYALEELKQMKITALFYKEDLVNHPLYFETLKSGATTLDHRRLKRKDGTHIEMEIGTKMMPDGRLMAIGRDITGRKKAAEQQALFAAIVNSSDDAIISKTTEGIITSWNRGAACLFGYRPEEVIGKNITLIVPPDLMDEEKMILAKIKKGDYVQHYETQRIKKDGTRVFVSLTVSPVKNSRGIVIGASKIARDITEKKEAEQKIIASEENLKAIFDNASEGFILLDTNGLVKAFNHRAAISSFNQFNKDIKTGSSIFDFPEETRKQHLKTVFSRVLQGETIQYERSYTESNNNIVWISFSFTPVKKNNFIRGVCITAHDITEKKIAEQQKEFDHNNLHALINNTSDLIWSVDRECKLITFNKACENFSLQLTGKILTPGVDLFDFEFGHLVAERYKTYYRRAFNGEVFTECNHYLQPVDYWSENSFYPIYEGAAVAGTACISRDITERKKTEEAVRKSFEENQILATRLAVILNTLPANIALLDKKGTIVDINDSWRHFADENGFIGIDYGIGNNYIAIAGNSDGKSVKDGIKVANGIKEVLENKRRDFIFEYPCHSPNVKRWFRMIVTQLQDKELSGAVVMHIDISELRKLEEERLNSKIEEQKMITRAMIQGQENERNQLGQELHDNISQLLAAIRMKLSFHQAKSAAKIPVIADCIENLEEAVKETRNLSHRMLMPRFKESSFQEALKELTNNYSISGRKVLLDTTGFSDNGTHPLILETVYRIAQEQLNNIEKHAKASTIMVTVGINRRQISLLIKDDGIGFDPKKKRKGIGITNIMNRAKSLNGSAKIITEPGKGCSLQIEIPLSEN